jgi:hypothetical protein
MNSVAASVIVCGLSEGGGPVILVAEAYVAVIDVEQPLVGDSDPVGVAADVVEHLSRAGERRLRVDHPLGVSRGLQVIGKALRIGQRLERGREPELAVRKGVV